MTRFACRWPIRRHQPGRPRAARHRPHGRARERCSRGKREQARRRRSTSPRSPTARHAAAFPPPLRVSQSCGTVRALTGRNRLGNCISLTRWGWETAELHANQTGKWRRKVTYSAGLSSARCTLPRSSTRKDAGSGRRSRPDQGSQACVQVAGALAPAHLAGSPFCVSMQMCCRLPPGRTGEHHPGDGRARRRQVSAGVRDPALT